MGGDDAWSDEDDEWDDTKSDTSERTLTLDTITIEVLRLHLAKQFKRRELLGAGWTESGRLFTTPTGVALDPAWISQKFERFVERHAAIRRRFLRDGWTRKRISIAYRVTIRAIDGALLMPLPPIRLHDTRHGAASLALAAGVDIAIVSGECGHATTAFTRDVYQHVFPELARAAADATASIVPRNGKTHNPMRACAHRRTKRTPQWGSSSMKSLVRMGGASRARTDDRRVMSPLL